MDRSQQVIFGRAGRRMQLIIDSYSRVTGRALLAKGADHPESLWDAPFAVIARGAEPEPRFFYANRCALELFEAKAGQLIEMPSHLSAKPINRAERNLLFARVAREGFIDDYCGDRITVRGREFRIKDATVWNLLDEEGWSHGQAARIESWQWLPEA